MTGENIKKTNGQRHAFGMTLPIGFRVPIIYFLQ